VASQPVSAPLPDGTIGDPDLAALRDERDLLRYKKSSTGEEDTLPKQEMLRADGLNPRRAESFGSRGNSECREFETSGVGPRCPAPCRDSRDSRCVKDSVINDALGQLNNLDIVEASGYVYFSMESEDTKLRHAKLSGTHSGNRRHRLWAN